VPRRCRWGTCAVACVGWWRTSSGGRYVLCATLHPYLTVFVCVVSSPSCVFAFVFALLWCATMEQAMLWKVAAHRGEVTDVAGTELAFVTGGADNKVCVWSRRTHQLMLQFTEHIKKVVAVLPDLLQPNLIHSAGADRCVFTYDLKKEKRVVGHQMGKSAVGAFTTLTQRKDSEQELITGGTDGRLLFWDCDIDRPVLALQDPAKSRVNGLAVSPTGRFVALCGDDHHVKIFDLKVRVCWRAWLFDRLPHTLLTAFVCVEQRQALLAATLGHSARVHSLRWSPDEKQLVSVGADCCICVWNFYGVD